MTAPVGHDWWGRFLGYRQSAYKADAATWTAACPTCGRDAEWWSGMTTSGLRYRLTCPSCGMSAWEAKP